MLKDLRYRLIVVLILVTGFCKGQEPVTIQIGDKSVEQDSIVDSFNSPRFSNILTANIGYDRFRLNGGRFGKFSLRYNHEKSWNYFVDVGFKFSSEDQKPRNNALSTLSMMYRSRNVADFQIDQCIGAEANLLTEQINNKTELFYGPAIGLIFHVRMNWHFHVYYKYNIVTFNNDLSTSNFMLQTSYRNVLRTKRNRLPGRPWFD